LPRVKLKYLKMMEQTMRFRILLLILAGIFFYSPVFCANVDTVLLEVEKNMGTVQTIQALFVQKKQMVMFDMPVTINGKIYIQNPDKFAWVVKAPIEHTLVIDEHTVKRWDKTNGTQSMSIKENPMFKEVIDQITFWFSGTYTACKKDYDVTLVQTEPIILEFAPKSHNPASRMLTKITLVFQDDKKYLSKIKLLEKNLDTTELSFKDVKINLAIDPSVWELN
jgi:outer membrane lipoprotein-sorting protein